MICLMQFQNHARVFLRYESNLVNLFRYPISEHQLHPWILDCQPDRDWKAGCCSHRLYCPQEKTNVFPLWDASALEHDSLVDSASINSCAPVKSHKCTCSGRTSHTCLPLGLHESTWGKTGKCCFVLVKCKLNVNTNHNNAGVPSFQIKTELVYYHKSNGFWSHIWGFH